jgi:hypothetical protein
VIKKADEPVNVQIMKMTTNQNNYFDNHVWATIAELNSRGICYTDIPEENRRRADKFEEKITDAINRKDRKMFLKALREWKGLFCK